MFLGTKKKKVPGIEWTISIGASNLPSPIDASTSPNTVSQRRIEKTHLGNSSPVS